MGLVGGWGRVNILKLGILPLGTKLYRWHWTKFYIDCYSSSVSVNNSFRANFNLILIVTALMGVGIFAGQ